MICKVILSKYSLRKIYFGTSFRTFKACCTCNNSVPAGSMFLCLERFYPNNTGWDLIVLSPTGEVSRASSYHFVK